MKLFRITLTEDQWNQFQTLIGELPTKFGVPFLNMINPNLQESTLEEPTPPVGGGGGSPIKPKP